MTRSPLLLALLVASAALADERLKGIACRSVHLGYPGPAGTAFYNEMAVVSSAPGTYFMAAGWDKGYFGMQELGNGKKLLIFSVWDSGQNDPKAVALDKQVKLLHKHPKVRTGRFGGEGTGGQSFFDYDWKAGVTYRFLVTSKIDGKRTEYAGWFFHPEERRWLHLVTFSTVTGGKDLGGYYSFVEDFKRDRVSTTKERRARYGNAWLKPVKGEWQALSTARFTADANPVTNIDAGLGDGLFYLATGGKVENAGTKLRATMKREAGERPGDLPVK